MEQPVSKGDQSRAEILDAARRLFIANGYNGTSMRAIADEAGGRAVGGIYNHFRTKEEIFSAIIEEMNPYDDLLAALDGIEAATAPEYVRTALGRVLRVMPRHIEFFQVAQIDLREFQGAHLRHVLDTRVLPAIVDVVQRVTVLPGLKPVTAVDLMRLMGSITIGYTITGMLAPTGLFNGRDDASWIELFIDTLLYGLADEPSHER